jgi:hypothetical protein
MALAIAGIVACAACSKPADPIAADIDSALERTVPPRGRVTLSYPLSRARGAASATWQVETELDWHAYAAWVELRLAEYRVAERGPDRLRFTRQLEGDSYTLTLAGKPDSKSLRVDASFEARPF